MILEAKYNWGDILYLKTDKDQLPRILTRMQFSKDSTMYELSCGNGSSWHFDFEMSVEKAVIFATTN
jgi:hypothetical protein